MENNKRGITGLTEEQVLEARAKYGENILQVKNENRLLHLLREILGEPMIVLLLVAAGIYFLTGNTSDGVFMVLAIILVFGISIFQEKRSSDALKKIKDFTQPHCRVYRDGELKSIRTSELVMGDYFQVEEGELVPADGTIVQANDFSVNESVLTGESLAVFKSENDEDKQVYQGTLIGTGLAVAVVTAIGNATRLGQIGETVDQIAAGKSPLEIQINNFVRKMAIVGSVVFFIVWAINYAASRDAVDSLMKALTLAMSILPEEIPVAFTTFMALGSWRLMNLGVVIKDIKTVETLGSATVICADKTGTLTENRMDVAQLFVLPNRFYDPAGELDESARELLTLSMWASEPLPFDPMEKSIHQLYGSQISDDQRPAFSMVKEYPLGGTPPMMTHVFRDQSGKEIIAAKGAMEALIAVSELSEEERQSVEEAAVKLSSKGYRILGVGEGIANETGFPASQQDIRFRFKGLVAFYDPPKSNMKEVLQSFYDAGISVKMITGDNEATASAIAQRIGFRGYDQTMKGADFLELSEQEMKDKARRVNIFSRVFPKVKMNIVNALKADQNIVAMTGDGVNDAPALKAAHIGIAMGKKGTEIARQSASLILLEDDLSKMVDAIAIGRKIYANLKKAIQYIISIHIPIILTVFLPLVLGWVYPNIFSPVHVIFLELIMGPTCSIIYENEPMEKNAMRLPPRPFTDTFFQWRELTVSVIQGLAITAGTLFIYQYAVSGNLNETETRTMVFLTLIVANIFLTLINRSFYYSMLSTFSYHNRLIPLVIAITIACCALILWIAPLRHLFEFTLLPFRQIMMCVLVGFCSVVWYEGVKWMKRRRG